MKAPDKIYIQTNAGEAFSSKWTTIPFRDFENTAYIRKEALLEWASQRREAVAKEVVIQEGVRLGADAAFEELIDKLNEM